MARSLSILRKLKRFASFDAGQQALLAEAAVWLLLARGALILIPFPRLAPHLGVFMSPADARVEAARAAGGEAEAQLAEEIGWAVVRAARHVPFQAVCLPQAMTAQMMLKRRGVSCVLHLGAAKGKEKPLDAHAWLDAAGVEVTGFPVARDFTEIACFV